MTAPHSIDLHTPALLMFSGPDAVRFLNGQVTQDVKQVAGSTKALPACITDHKGRLQFRVWLHARDGAIFVEAPSEQDEALEARLTRYLIADDVEVTNLSGQWHLYHVTDTSAAPCIPAHAITRESMRLGAPGIDCWLPANAAQDAIAGIPQLHGDALESLRIARAIPSWGRELREGILPPEAGLDATDISYHKGCYIGQEVISRIKFAGKLNQRLARLSFDASIPTDGLQLVDTDGAQVGQITSIAPIAHGDTRHALAYIKRGANDLHLQLIDGSLRDCQVV